jgi:diguanylate cyclase (GGDEF)-like protein
LIRRLNILCTFAACALDGMLRRHERPDDDDEPLENSASHGGQRACGIVRSPGDSGRARILHDATFLNAVLPFAISQAQRYREPLSLMCVAIDRLSGIQEMLGRDSADYLVRFVGETLLLLLRASDIIARLDDDRIVAVLLRSGEEGALHVSEKISETVAESSRSLSDLAGLQITVSIGAATYPTAARDAFSLFDAADEALAQAQSQGPGHTVLSRRRSIAGRNPGASRAHTERLTRGAP